MKFTSMSNTLLGMLALGLFSTGAQAASGVGPYYATPSWDQTLPATTRFIDLTNMPGAVLDRETGLVWEKVPSTDLSNWFDASDHCNRMSLGGRKGWRLPTIQDLASLIDPTQTFPSLPSGHPFAIVSSDYWSATTNAGFPSDAWEVDFSIGFVRNNNKTAEVGNSALLRAWCVRGGQGVDPQ